MIPKDDSVRLLSQIIEEMNLEKLYKTYSRIRGNIDLSANRYTFVWKKSINKNMAKMMNNISDFILKCEIDFGIKIIYKYKIKIYHLKKFLKKLKKISKESNITFVHRKGKKKSIEQLNNYIDRLKKYTKDLHIMGERNSYSKFINL